MADVLTELAIELRSILTKLYKKNCVQIRFVKRHDIHRNVIGVTFMYPANWPNATYEAINAALLSLHHNGYIFYGTNTVTTREKLLQVESTSNRNSI